MNELKRITKKIEFNFELELLTGMRIGGSDPGIAIGAIDAPVIRDPITQEPYIPGSSLKGKIRSNLEKVLAQYTINNNVCGPSDGKEDINGEISVADLFGIPANASSKDKNDKDKIVEAEKTDKNKEIKQLSSRLIFRDAFLTNTSKKLLNEKVNYLDTQFTEVKTENSIDRLSGGVSSAGGLRSFERVPKGVSFDCSITLILWDTDEIKDNNTKCKLDLYKKAISMGLTLLETDYLGGCGTRGYGQVKVIGKYVKTYDLQKLGEEKIIWEEFEIKDDLEKKVDFEKYLDFKSIYPEQYSKPQE